MASGAARSPLKVCQAGTCGFCVRAAVIRSSHGFAWRRSKVSRASARSGSPTSAWPSAVSHSACSSWATARWNGRSSSARSRSAVSRVAARSRRRRSEWAVSSSGSVEPCSCAGCAGLWCGSFGWSVFAGIGCGVPTNARPAGGPPRLRQLRVLSSFRQNATPSLAGSSDEGDTLARGKQVTRGPTMQPRLRNRRPSVAITTRWWVRSERRL
jgi:hypothetical protein